MSDTTRVGLGVYVGSAEGVSVRVKVVTMQQAYVVPVLLAESLQPAAVVYGTVFPLVAYAAVRQLVINPWLRAREQRELEEKRRRNAVLVKQQREQARAAVVLMQETVQRKIESEERVHGLVVVQAWYGRLVEGNESSGRAGAGAGLWGASFFSSSSSSSSSSSPMPTAEASDTDPVVGRAECSWVQGEVVW